MPCSIRGGAVLRAMRQGSCCINSFCQIERSIISHAQAILRVVGRATAMKAEEAEAGLAMINLGLVMSPNSRRKAEDPETEVLRQLRVSHLGVPAVGVRE